MSRNKIQLIVEFNDGSIIQFDRDKGIVKKNEIFVGAIKKLGVDNIIRKYNPKRYGEDLISKGKHSRHQGASKELGAGYYLQTHGDTSFIKHTIEKIGIELKISIKVNIIRLETVE